MHLPRRGSCRAKAGYGDNTDIWWVLRLLGAPTDADDANKERLTMYCFTAAALHRQSPPICCMPAPVHVVSTLSLCMKFLISAKEQGPPCSIVSYSHTAVVTGHALPLLTSTTAFELPMCLHHAMLGQPRSLPGQHSRPARVQRLPQP
jgi:hypothetical protein